MGFPWGFFGISIGFQKDVYGVPMRVLFSVQEDSMVFLWHVYNIPVGFLLGSPKGFHDISLGFLWHFYRKRGSCEISMVFLCGFHGNSVVCWWDSYRISMIFYFYVYDIFLQLIWCLRMISMRFLLHSHGVSFGYLKYS